MCRFTLDSVTKTKPERPRLIDTIDSVNWTSEASWFLPLTMIYLTPCEKDITLRRTFSARGHKDVRLRKR